MEKKRKILITIQLLYISFIIFTKLFHGQIVIQNSFIISMLKVTICNITNLVNSKPL